MQLRKAGRVEIHRSLLRKSSAVEMKMAAMLGEPVCTAERRSLDTRAWYFRSRAPKKKAA